MKNLRTLLSLFTTFFKIGCVTFGGGLAMLPILEREMVEKRKWATHEELLDYYAISQTTPGIIAVNVATFIGHKQKGIVGAVFATIGMVLPSLIIITLIAEFISNFEDIEWVKKALKGINVAVAALLTYSVFNLAKKNVKKWYHFIIFAAAFIAVYYFHITALFVTVFAIVLGIVLHFTVFNRNKEGK